MFLWIQLEVDSELDLALFKMHSLKLFNGNFYPFKKTIYILQYLEIPYFTEILPAPI